MTYGYPYSHRPSLIWRVLRSRTLAIAFIVLALALLAAGIWWDNQRTDAVTERLRAAAVVTPTSIAAPAAKAPVTPPAADAPTSHLEVSQAPPAAG